MEQQDLGLRSSFTSSFSFQRNKSGAKESFQVDFRRWITFQKCVSDLRFEDEVLERLFVASRSDELGRAAAIVAGVVAFVLVLLMIVGLVESPSSYPQEASSTIFTIQLITVIASIGVCVAVGPAWCRKQLGPPSIEAVGIAYTYYTILMLVVPVDAYYLPMLLGLGQPPRYCDGGQHYSDTSILLRQTAVLVGTHLMMPLRWAVLWPSEVVIITLFAIATLAIGSSEGLERGVHNLIVVVIIVTGVSVGKRMVEASERESFRHLLQEKRRRLGSQSQLARLAAGAGGGLTNSSRGEDEEDDEEPSTPLSEPVFGGLTLDTSDRAVEPSEWANLHDRLAELRGIGMEERWLMHSRKDCQIEDADEVSGFGGFGQLRRGTFHGLPVAVKIAVANDSDASRRHFTSVLSLLNELRIFRRVRHPNIVLFHGAYVNAANPDIGIVLEYVDGMTLKEVVKKPPGRPTAPKRLSILLDICMAVRYLHAQCPSIVHGDLKPENILVESEERGMRAKLIDFGLSVLVCKTSRALGCTPAFAAPELRLQPLECPTPKADVFSFALLACFTVTGANAYQGGSVSQVVQAVVADEFEDYIKIDWPSGAPLTQECKLLCMKCCTANPVVRPSMATIHEEIQQWSARVKPSKQQTRRGGSS